MFVSLIFNLLGYDISQLTLEKQPEFGSTEVISKKQKTSNDGSHEDWDYLLNSGHHISFGTSLANMLNLKNFNVSDPKMSTSGFELNPNLHKLTEITEVTQTASEMDTTSQEYSVQNEKNIEFNYGSLLFPHILQILFSLHLLYEELKLNILLIEDLQPLAQFLYQLCIDLKLDAYIVHYWKDCPDSCNLYYDGTLRQIPEISLKKIIQPVYFTSEPPSIFNHIYLLLQKKSQEKYPFINGVNVTSKDIIEVLRLNKFSVFSFT